MKNIRGFVVILLVGLTCLAASGCRTFNWTDEDEAKDRERYFNEDTSLRGLPFFFAPP